MPHKEFLNYMFTHHTPYIQKHPLLTGTLILSAAGILCRIIGFLYRIFLSNAFGPESMGIYQMIGPISALCYSLSAAGIQTAISKLVAEHNHSRLSLSVFKFGTACALFISACFCVLVYANADTISLFYLKESRCAPLLRILTLAMPFSVLHACLNGFFFGTKKVSIPAIGQLFEQLVRVLSVLFIYKAILLQNKQPNIALAVVGIFLGEMASCTFTAIALLFQKTTLQKTTTRFPKVKFFKIAVPLSASRIITNLLQSIEAVYIPQSLLAYGLTKSQALSVYGVLTGMSLPFILFPTAFIHALNAQLLPAIAEANVQKDYEKIHQLCKRTSYSSFLGGFICTIFFLIFGSVAGKLLFSNILAGKFIMILGFLCPFLYLTGIWNSILNGLSMPHITFLISCISMLIRLLFIFLFIPLYGIYGYLIGLLISQLCHTIFLAYFIKKVCRR